MFSISHNRIQKNKIRLILEEYARITNLYIDYLWENPIERCFDINKSIVDLVKSDIFGANIKYTAAQEAFAMVQAMRKREENNPKEKMSKPVHRGKKMTLSSHEIVFSENRDSKTFNAWLHFKSIGKINGKKLIFDIPINYHRHYNKLALRGVRANSYIVREDSVQLCFKIETGPKKTGKNAIGVDTGINALASTSSGKQYGTDIKECIERIKRCKHGSKGQKRAVRALKHRMNEVARDIINEDSPDTIVVENLKNISRNTKVKRRLNKNMRRSIGRWNLATWMGSLEKQCEDNRVSFRRVAPYYTSQTCPSCNHVDRLNRAGEIFCCRKCGCTDNADIAASKNILARFNTGPYGASCKLNQQKNQGKKMQIPLSKAFIHEQLYLPSVLMV